MSLPVWIYRYIPVYITVKHSHLVHQGTISGFAAKPATLPEGFDAVSASFMLLNTGNHDYKFRTIMTATDNNGHIVGSWDQGLSLWTLLPDMSREVITALTPQIEMPPGEYSLTLSVSLEDGTLIARESTSFRLSTALLPVTSLTGLPPGENSGLVSSITLPADNGLHPEPDGIISSNGSTSKLTLLLGMAGAAAILVFVVCMLAARFFKH